MRVARMSTAVFGLLAMVVALLVKSMGGIVEVILSVAAITGAALYLPPMWSLFSKRQTGRSTLTATLLSLAINLFFKFAAPVLLGLTLTRGQEMMLGVISPVIILIYHEIKYILKKSISPAYIRYENTISVSSAEDTVAEAENTIVQNRHGQDVIGTGIILSGILITVFGILAESGKLLVVGVGIIIILLGSIIKPSKKKHKQLK